MIPALSPSPIARKLPERTLPMEQSGKSPQKQTAPSGSTWAKYQATGQRSWPNVRGCSPK